MYYRPYSRAHKELDLWQKPGLAIFVHWFAALLFLPCVRPWNFVFLWQHSIWATWYLIGIYPRILEVPEQELRNFVHTRFALVLSLALLLVGAYWPIKWLITNHALLRVLAGTCFIANPDTSCSQQNRTQLPFLATVSCRRLMAALQSNQSYVFHYQSVY